MGADVQESIKDYRDYYSTMKTAHKKGRAEGLAEGLAEGEAKERIKNARAMKADNMPAELIAKYTGLTIEEIATL